MTSSEGRVMGECAENGKWRDLHFLICASICSSAQWWGQKHMRKGTPQGVQAQEQWLKRGQEPAACAQHSVLVSPRILQAWGAPALSSLFKDQEVTGSKHTAE